MQTCIGQLSIEICVCDDNSTDDTLELLEKWKEILSEKNIGLDIFKNTSGKSGGVGYAKNRAVDISKGRYLCFQDIDDQMLPDRIRQQYDAGESLGNDYLVGTKFERFPVNSTVRYTSWANNLTREQLNIQIYTANGPTVIMPTWFLHRSAYDRYELVFIRQ